MKKILNISMLILLFATVVVSCKKSGDGDDGPKEVAVSPIKTLGVVYPSGTEIYQFTYDDKKRVSKIEDYWENDLAEVISYDYSVAGKLTITKGTDATTYDINAKGLITKEDWGGGEYVAYEYDANDYLVKVIEHWGNADHVKLEAVITNGNIVKHTSYTDDGEVSRIKEFVYTPGDNVNGIHQASLIDSNTKPMGNLYGKPSKKIASSLTYWDPRVTPIEQRTTTLSYEFDTKQRPVKMTRTLFNGEKEVYTYGYYD